jgi:hypothetical protein
MFGILFFICIILSMLSWALAVVDKQKYTEADWGTPAEAKYSARSDYRSMIAFCSFVLAVIFAIKW